MPSANEFADLALKLLNRGNIAYAKGGKDLKGMDSAGFIEYCLKQLGVNVRYSGTNDLYRNGGSQVFDLSSALSYQRVVPGVILLHVSYDGEEPVKYKQDGKGNCDYALICTEPGWAVYPSQKEGKLIKTRIEVKEGKANMVMLSNHLSYDNYIQNQQSSIAVNNNAQVFTGGKGPLILRKSPSKAGDIICSMPEGSNLSVITAVAEWVQVKYTDSRSTRHEGWCMKEFLKMG